jgi:cysteine-rich repeat protein
LKYSAHYSEQCDDSNTDNGDGCSSTCQIESGFECTSVEAALSSCNLICSNGNTEVSESEECDDGNVADNDGCSSTCLIEPLYQCDGSTTQSPDGTNSTCDISCGDGVKYSAHYSEQCDDSNTDNGDGCSNTC